MRNVAATVASVSNAAAVAVVAGATEVSGQLVAWLTFASTVGTYFAKAPFTDPPEKKKR